MPLQKFGLLPSLLIGAAPVLAQINAGALPPTPAPPFKLDEGGAVRPALAHRLPAGRAHAGHREDRQAVPRDAVRAEGGGRGRAAGAVREAERPAGRLPGAVLRSDGAIYLTYSEPGPAAGTSSLALARATLKIGADAASLEGLKVVWRDPVKGKGGQAGAAVAFSPDQKFLFLTAGDRQRFTPAQDPNQPVGKILRLTLDGQPAPGNPMAGKIGATSVPVIDPPQRHRGREDRAGRAHLRVRRPQPDAVRNLDHRPPHALRPRVRAGRPPVGAGARPARRRRAQPDRAGQELRLADGLLCGELRRRAHRQSRHAPRPRQARRSTGRPCSRPAA